MARPDGWSIVTFQIHQMSAYIYNMHAELRTLTNTLQGLQNDIRKQDVAIRAIVKTLELILGICKDIQPNLVASHAKGKTATGSENLDLLGKLSSNGSTELISWNVMEKSAFVLDPKTHDFSPASEVNNDWVELPGVLGFLSASKHAPSKPDPMMPPSEPVGPHHSSSRKVARAIPVCQPKLDNDWVQNDNTMCSDTHSYLSPKSSGILGVSNDFLQQTHLEAGTKMISKSIDEDHRPLKDSLHNTSPEASQDPFIGPTSSKHKIALGQTLAKLNYPSLQSPPKLIKPLLEATRNDTLLESERETSLILPLQSDTSYSSTVSVGLENAAMCLPSAAKEHQDPSKLKLLPNKVIDSAHSSPSKHGPLIPIPIPEYREQHDTLPTTALSLLDSDVYIDWKEPGDLTKLSPSKTHNLNIAGLEKFLESRKHPEPGETADGSTYKSQDRYSSTKDAYEQHEKEELRDKSSEKPLLLHSRFNHDFVPPTPTFTKQLGSALDAESKAIVLKPRPTTVPRQRSSASVSLPPNVGHDRWHDHDVLWRRQRNAEGFVYWTLGDEAAGVSDEQRDDDLEPGIE